MALVDDQQRVVRQVFEQRRRRLARRAARQVARIVLDAGAVAGRLQHLQIEAGALLQPLGFQQLPVLLEPGEALLQLRLDVADGLADRRARRDVVAVGVDRHGIERGGALARQGIELVDLLDLVAEEAEPPGAVLVMRREDLDRVAAHPEGAAREVLVVAPVLQRHELLQQVADPDAVALLQRDRHALVGLSEPMP